LHYLAEEVDRAVECGYIKSKCGFLIFDHIRECEKNTRRRLNYAVFFVFLKIL